MSNLNPRTIDTVSIKEVKELDEFLKAYNNVRDLPTEEIKEKVIEAYGGKLTTDAFDELLERSKTYTKTKTVPTTAEWSQVRVVYREIGNQKIASSKERLESASKKYNGTAYVEDMVYGNITPYQAVKNLDSAQKKVTVAIRLRVVTSLVLGIAGFALMAFLSKLVIVTALNLSGAVMQILAGVLSLVGLLGGAGIGYKLMNIVLNSFKKDRDEAEITESKYHSEIVHLQTEIKSAEENKNRIESQYGVEIFAQTHFTKDVQKPVKKKIKPEVKAEDTEPVKEPIKEEEIKVPLTPEKPEEPAKSNDLVEENAEKVVSKSPKVENTNKAESAPKKTMGTAVQTKKKAQTEDGSKIIKEVKTSSKPVVKKVVKKEEGQSPNTNK